MSTAKKLLSGSGASADRINVEDVFSTHMYLGSGSSSQKYPSGGADFDLLNEGGMVWIKNRSSSANHALFDTVRGVGKGLETSTAAVQTTSASGDLTAFTSNGYTVGTNFNQNINTSGDTYVGWAFRKAEKFFDIVTYTGNATARSISHNLGSVPGMIIIKQLDATRNWEVYHRSLSIETGDYPYILQLNTDAAQVGNQTFFKSGITSTEFKIAHYNAVNQNGGSYIAYLFAHNDDDGGYGPNGDLDIIKCGSFTTDSSGDALVGGNLGWEPQWVMVKNATSTGSGSWWIADTHRGFSCVGYGSDTGRTHYFTANNPTAEGVFIGPSTLNLNSTGFSMPSNAFAPGQTFVYMAIRRAPTKEAESGPEVFGINAGGSTNYFTDGSINYMGVSPDDLVIVKRRDSTTPADQQWCVTDRMRGIEPFTSWTTSTTTATPTLFTHSTAAESLSGNRAGKYPGTTGNGGGNASSTNILATNLAPGISYWWRRSPKYFDVVGYVGDGSTAQTITHNLQGIPKMIWGKRRDDTSNWMVYYGSTLYTLFLNSTTNFTGISPFQNIPHDYQPLSSSTQFGVAVYSGGNADKSLNTSGAEYILYIFGEQTGITKIGTYSGTGSDLNIDCGFAARWVMIRDATSGNSGQPWYVYDTTRGIAAGNDKIIKFDTTAAETESDAIDPHSSGFTVVGGQAHNVSGDTYFFYAIA
tara:strand:+ start:4926 stop:7019 length:2094 start_codon:yes stop_codon:yes gene_type:complete